MSKERGTVCDDDAAAGRELVEAEEHHLEPHTATVH
jgi:hypothetical protein